MSINGGGSTVNSERYVYLQLNDKGYIFEHKFYVFDQLPCKTDGILGQDFLKKFKATIDFELNLIQLSTLQGQLVTLKVNYFELKSSSYLTVPAQIESIHYINTELREDCVINSQELCSRVYLANMIAKPKNGKVAIRVMNTRNEEVNLNYFNVHVSKSNEYHICQFSKPSINSDRVKLLFSLLKISDLNTEEQKAIENICAKFPDVFHLPGDKLTTTALYEQTIELQTHSTPVYVKPYRLPHAQKAEIDKQIQGMLEDGMIEETRSAWSSPLLLVPKKLDSSGVKKWRVVIDYRKLNNQIKDDKFPLPNEGVKHTGKA